jgi:glycosyltransferase involved in cell wall biosynthesis
MSWLFISDRAAAAPLGGMTVVLTETGVRLAGPGEEAHWITGRLNDSLPEEGSWQGFNAHTFPFSGTLGPRTLLKAVRAIRRRTRTVIEENEITASVVHQPLAGLGAGPVLKQNGISSCYFFHSPWRQEYLLNAGGRGIIVQLSAGIRRQLEARALSHFDRIVVFSRFMADWVEQEHPEAPPPTMVAPGVDLDRFQPVPDRAQARRKLGWSEANFSILCLRRLVPRTGVDLMLDAFSRIAPEYPGVTLFIGGEGPLEASLRSRADQLGMSDRVVFLGYINGEHHRLGLAAADLVVMPTLALEGLGLVTLEAMASGTAVIGTPVGGTVELLQPFRPELLAGEVTGDALADVLNHMLKRGAEGVHQIGLEARTHVEARYGWDRTTADLKRVLEVS